MKKIVFVSHPYSSNSEVNFKKVQKIVKYWTKKSYLVLHLFSFLDNDLDRDVIMDIYMKMIDISDIVAVYGQSQRCKEEEEYAIANGKEVLKFYEEINFEEFKDMVENNTEIHLKA